MNQSISDGRAVQAEATEGLSRWVTIPRMLYTRLGIKRGVGRMVMTLARNRKSLHQMPVRLNDGRILQLDLREPMCMHYLLAGEIWMESGPTGVARSFLKPGEVAIDIGTNVGWYSTLFSERVGPDGKVYGFEPSAKAYSLVTETARAYPQLEIIQAALSNEEGEAELHLPPWGEMASLHHRPGVVTTQKCRTTTLDLFLESKGNPEIAFIKCDAEGAELDILHGAEKMLGSQRPPTWLMEINVPTAELFGYHPDRLFEYFYSFKEVGYRAYKIEATTGTLELLEPPIDLVRNDAIIVPAWQKDRLAAYLQGIGQDLQVMK
jgi:FkbM family methyltransferase